MLYAPTAHPASVYRLLYYMGSWVGRFCNRSAIRTIASRSYVTISRFWNAGLNRGDDRKRTFKTMANGANRKKTSKTPQTNTRQNNFHTIIYLKTTNIIVSNSSCNGCCCYYLTSCIWALEHSQTTTPLSQKTKKGTKALAIFIFF